MVGACFHNSSRNDPEHLLEQYLTVGPEQLARDVEGFFSIIVGDAFRQEITVITDIIASCHFYAREVAGNAVLSSSPLILASIADVTPDPVGCQEFIGTGVIYEDRTLYREVRKLPPASVIRFRDGIQVETERYWNASELSPESISNKRAPEMLWQALTSSVGKIGKQFDSVACDLTGGYDSRAVAAAFLGVSKQFTAVVSGPESSADVVISRELSRRLQLPHLHYPPFRETSYEDLRNAFQLCDGEYDIVEYSRIARIHDELAKHFQISINGSFGEVARGYWWELLFPHTGANKKLNAEKIAARRYAGDSGDLFQRNLRISVTRHMAGVLERATADLGNTSNTFHLDMAYLRMRMQCWQGKIASSTNQIWPCISPFMFRRVVEVMLQAGHAVRRRSLLIRRMLAQYQPTVARFPLEHGYPAVPARWTNLHQFSPLLSYYGSRVVQKARSRLGANLASPGQENCRLALWNSAEVKSLLDVQAMKSVAILETSSLERFLAESKTVTFARGLEWQRLLSLEAALRPEVASG